MLQTSAPTAKADLEAYYRAIRKRLRSPPAAVFALKRPDVAAPSPEPPAVAHVAVVPDLARDILRIATPPADTSPVRVKRIIAECAEKHGVTVLDILSVRRAAAYVEARHEAMWRAKNETSWSLPRIGKAMGGRDHSSVLHAFRKIEERVRSCSKWRKFYCGDSP